ncbi:MAG: haloacid dehalogenase-like hydrolase [Nitrospirae bacterium]|nr:haloacid dehalogenase-like hydrolase [Nitrospirota bacterium]
MNKGKMKNLILFDIDGTLITAGGAGTRSLNLAFHALFKIEDAFKDITMAGKTDIQIIKEGLDTHGFSMDGNVDKMTEMYLQFLQEKINNPWKMMKPGIVDLLDLLKDHGMPLGLLTGNLKEGARIKLAPFRLNEYFLDGAFGSDDEDRDNLLPIAVEKFARRGYAFSLRQCIVIGDTPRDVRCAKIHGAYCVAVATGPYPKDELLKTDADIVFDSLQDAAACMEFIKKCAGPSHRVS